VGERRLQVCAGVLAIALVGCGTTGAVAPPHPDHVGRALTQVLSAEAEQMGVDSRAHHFRVQARRQYQEATRAMAEQDMLRANRLIDRALVDAELAVALARRENWHQQAEERSAALYELENQPAAGARP
jgi:hypothetical protein